MSCPSPQKLEAVIRTVMPTCRDPGIWSRYLGEATAMFGITEDDRLDDFLAQIAVESGEMNHTEENLNYSADRLVAVWPKRFPIRAAALPYANNPQLLANRVYGGRFGNTGPDDGWLYRGSGLIQTTFKDNYLKAGIALGIDLVAHPELLRQPRWAALSAAAYWKDRGLSRLAEAQPGDNAQADFLTITKAINAAAEGLTRRQMYWTRARTALGLARVM